MKYEELESSISVIDGSVQEKFTMVQNSFILNPEYTPNEKIIFIALLAYAFRKGSSFPGQERLATELKLSRTTINQTMKKLEEKGAFFKVPQYKESNRRISNMYFLANIDEKGFFDKLSLYKYKELIKDGKIIVRGK